MANATPTHTRTATATHRHIYNADGWPSGRCLEGTPRPPATGLGDTEHPCEGPRDAPLPAPRCLSPRLSRSHRHLWQRGQACPPLRATLGGCQSPGRGEEGDALPLVTAPAGPTATGRHGAACDRRNRQPQHREAEPQGVGAPLPLAPPLPGTGRKGSHTPGPPPGIGAVGGPQRLLQAAVPAEPSTAPPGAASPPPRPRPQGWQLGVTGVPTGTPHSTAVPERSPCPTNAACGGRRAGAAATCSPAAGGGSSLQGRSH